MPSLRAVYWFLFLNLVPLALSCGSRSALPFGADGLGGRGTGGNSAGGSTANSGGTVLPDGGPTDDAASPLDASYDAGPEGGVVVGPCGHTQGLQSGAPWPMFHRCPTHIGRSDVNGPSSPKIEWVFATNGPLVTPPVVGEYETIYVGLSPDSLYALSLDGSVQWTSSLGSIPRGAPAISADGIIYVRSDAALHATTPTGQPLWSRPLPGIGTSSPVIGPDGTIYVGGGPQLHAIKPDGEILWQVSVENSVRAAPALGVDGTLYVGDERSSYPDGTYEGGKIYAIDSSGVIHWTYDAGGSVYGSVALGVDGTIYVGSYGNLLALNADGTVKWQAPVGAQVVASASLGTTDTVYLPVDSFVLSAFSPSGDNLWDFGWSSYPETSSVVDAKGWIYVGAEDGWIHALGSDGTEKWSTQNGNQEWQGLAMGADGTLYATNHTGGRVIAIGQDDE